MKKTGRKGRMRADTPSGHFKEIGYDKSRGRGSGESEKTAYR
ncbi:MAG: hypothetical protein K0R76_71 [Alphaproteobacteria bacterium]|nr:hypothetical protein [Alphaproteobacteria bacterium]